MAHSRVFQKEVVIKTKCHDLRIVERYDNIGRTYTATRQPDPTIESEIWEALGDARSVVNVGAGAGSYEPRDRAVIAIEPSIEMIKKRPLDAASARQGFAESLPLADNSVDASLALFTIHHWEDARRGIRELLRVARQRIVILTWDKSYAGSFWLTRDYLPELEEWTVAHLLSLSEIESELAGVHRRAVPIPRNCRDGFLRAFWARPEAYLDEQVRRNISQFNLIDEAAVTRGIARLDRDLSSGEWDAHNGHLRTLNSLDLGYCILVATKTEP